MGRAKLCDPGARLGEVFVECAENTEFPGFGFLRQAKTAPWGGNTTPRREKPNPEDRRKAIGRILASCRVPKWKSRLKPSEPAATPVLQLPPTTIVVTPDDKGPLVLPGVATFVLRRVTPAAGAACSVPLINVLPKGRLTSDPKIVLPGSKGLASLDLMPVFRGSPPCPQVHR
jgi:hypothetical protein